MSVPCGWREGGAAGFSRLLFGLGFLGFALEDLNRGLVDGKAFVGELGDSTSDSGDPKGKGFGVFEKLVEILGA